jgi:hypothetical protein
LDDGTKAPFVISSAIAFEDLHILIAKKLGPDTFPGLIQLRYRLDTDKAKDGATSIRTEEELDLFKERMRDLTVPQRLPSGKISTRAPKIVRVYFEDASKETKTGDTNADNKKVR